MLTTLDRALEKLRRLFDGDPRARICCWNCARFTLGSAVVGGGPELASGYCGPRVKGVALGRPVNGAGYCERYVRRPR